jgi:RNase P/RNase MRP subunit POP5
VLKRREKRRYLSIMHVGSANDAVGAIVKRCSDLFGSIATEKAAIRLISSENNRTIIKFRFDQQDNVLVSIALSDPPVVTLDMSGSMKRLERRRVLEYIKI